VYRKHSTVLQNELAAIIKGRLELSEDNPPTIIVDQVQTVEAVSETKEFVVLRTPKHEDYPSLFDSILSVLSSYPGDCDITLETEVDESTMVRVKANPALRIRRSPELEAALKDLGCQMAIERIADQTKSTVN
jgi:hypothetical protein